jgi:hypothetical protein
MNKQSLYGVVLALCLLAGFGPSASAQGTKLLVAIEQQPTAFTDSRLFDYLSTELTRDARIQVEPIPACNPAQASSRAQAFDLERLVTDGRQRLGQYLLYIRVSSERYDRRKTFSVPLVFHKWEVIGVIEGEWRLIDVARGKLVRAEPFHIELNGKRVIQATMDDNVDDPDINMSAPDKIQFFGQLERTLSDQIIARTSGQIGKPDREFVSRPVEKK